MPGVGTVGIFHNPMYIHRPMPLSDAIARCVAAARMAFGYRAGHGHALFAHFAAPLTGPIYQLVPVFGIQKCLLFFSSLHTSKFKVLQKSIRS